MDTSIEFECFDGTGNFPAWQSNVRMAIRAKGASAAINSKLTVRDSCTQLEVFQYRELEKLDGLACVVITGMLAPSLHGLARDITAFQLWNDLQTMFGSSNTSHIVN
ncbi:hypothetical protein COEREDRAFT_12150 [Coemansia reversa NRRL 1564]|uniref:Uncharacterized protein n=1 Tax=Coemansia reversa (strain ATCC 12441 / NRRL 1564) TaxID=763665 RepID=A0A2G5B1B0_COERN|nr:hypothetical protein COEREDRAFT_12150 [Coemansia reversa NRRL 1564]|eukprot:PIA12808.1 hypothetical protein COEREDRAFT_12150 [Coemansia reversa NRRL 1564]